MNIVLIGMRGAGKTTVAKILSKKLHRHYIEIDNLIEEKTGKKISDLVKNKGWEYFRDIESQVINDISEKDNCIISAGGGSIIKEENVKALKRHGQIFWLQANIDVLINRIGNDSTRPFLTDANNRKEDMEKTLEKRIMLYQKAADVNVDTENIPAEKVADEILTHLEDEYVY